MWYGYIPSSHISASICTFNRDFCGFTDNRFVYQKFKEFVENCGCANILETTIGVHQFEQQKDCIDAINFVLLENRMIVPERHKLECRSSQSIDTNTVAIVSEVMYENFTACLCMNQEVRKIIADLYRLCSEHAVNKLYKYLGDQVKDKNIIFQIIGKLHEMYDIVGPTLMGRGEYALLNRTCTHQALMWEVFDEPAQINQYLDKVYRIGFDLTDPIIQGSISGMFY